MSPSKQANIALLKKEIGISQHIPITHLCEPTIFESSNGMLGMVLAIRGVTFDTERHEVLNQYKQTWHRALTALDERFGVMVTVHRHQQETHLKGEFQNHFLKELDAAYHQQFQDKPFYINDIYLIVLYRGITTGKAGKSINFLQKLSHRTIKEARSHARTQQIKALKGAVSQLQTTLSMFNPQLLGEGDNEVGHSELISFLSLIINGGESLSLPFTNYATPINKNIAVTEKNLVRYPEGNLAQYLTNKRIFFGSLIQFQGAGESDVTFGAMVTIKRYGTQSASIMLDPLLHLNCNFISTNSFFIEAKDVVLEQIKRHLIKMHNVNDPAQSQWEALHTARDAVASEQISMGYHHNTVLILAKTKADVERAVSQTIKCYSDAGFTAVRETIGQEPAFFAQVPTNLKYIARNSLITSENFVDFAPLHNYHNGFCDGNHLGSAVTLLETPSKTPYFFNYHVKGSQNNPSKGHATIIGGNNAGKTVLMTFLDAQMSRYGGNTFYFDRDRGAEIYIRACNGYYAVLSPDHPGTTQFNPFQLDDTPSNRQFNREFLAQLCKREDELNLDADITETLKICVDYAYEQLAKPHRILSAIVKLLPIQFPRWPELRRWLRSDSKYADGEYAYLFDNPNDSLALYQHMGFDMTHFLDKEPPHVRTALLMYLFQRIDLSLTGQRVSILLDEGWQYFIDPYWQGKLQRWLPTLRKRNGHIVMATQSPSSVIQSGIRSQILDNAATQIFFANPQAERRDYIDGFHLSETEFQAIANNVPESRLFLVKQEHDSALCRLNLSQQKELLWVLSGNTQSVALLDQIRSELGDDPKLWLPEFIKRRQEFCA